MTALQKDMTWALNLSGKLYREGGVAEARLQAKCRREQMSRTAVLLEWGDPRDWPEVATVSSSKEQDKQ